LSRQDASGTRMCSFKENLTDASLYNVKCGGKIITVVRLGNVD